MSQILPILQKMNVDVSKRNVSGTDVVKQGDILSRNLHITLCDKGRPIVVEQGVAVLLNITRPDGFKGGQGGSVNEDGSISVVLPVWALTVTGHIKCSVSLIDAEGLKLTSSSFTKYVEELEYDGSEVTPDDPEVNILVDLIAQVAAINVVAEQAKNDAQDFASISRKYADGKDLNGVADEDFATDNAKYYRDQCVVIGAEKADIIIGGTENNLVGIDANGNIKDSGKKASDFETADENILKKANVVNDLVTGGIDVPLSAEQGKLLKDGKVDKVVGKALSTNNYDDIEKAQVATNKSDIASLGGTLDAISEIQDIVIEETTVTETLFDSSTDAFVQGIIYPDGSVASADYAIMTPKLDVSGADSVDIEINSFIPCNDVTERLLWMAQFDASGALLIRDYVYLDSYDVNGNRLTFRSLEDLGSLLGVNAHEDAAYAKGTVVLQEGTAEFCIFNLSRNTATGISDTVDMQLTFERTETTTVQKRLIKEEALPPCTEAAEAKRIAEEAKALALANNMEYKVVSNNLFNKGTATTGKTVYLGKNTSGEELYGWYCTGAVNTVGTSVSGTGYDSTSTAIEIEGGQTYRKSNLIIVNFFDEDDVWVSHPAVGHGSVSFTSPNNAKYARLTFISSNINSVQFVKGEKPLPYDDWKLGAEGLATEQYTQITELLARNALNVPYMQEYMWAITEEAHKHTSPNRHTFLFVSDTHAKAMSNRVMSMVASMTKYVPCSYVAHGGDIIDGTSQKSNELLLLSTLVRNANEAQCPTYYAKGNHDWNVIYKNNNPTAPDDEYILNAELARRTNCFNKKDVHGNMEEMYFYVDDEVTKVRTIFINCFNEGESGSVADLQGTVQVYTQEQLEWFANEALNFSGKENRTEWGVIVIGHQSVKSPIAKTLVNFKNGTSESISVTELGETFTVSVDFEEQGAMEVIAVFVGDNHYDDLVRKSSTYGIAEIFILNAGLANDYANASLPTSTALKPPNKEFGTENETAFDIVTVDRENHLIYLTRYGARSYVKNEQTEAYDKIAARTRVVDYSTVSYVVREEE